MSFKRSKISFETAGVNALLMRFGNELDPELPAYLRALRQYLLHTYAAIVEQVIPAYTTVLVEYDPRQCRMYDLQLLLERAVDELDSGDFKVEAAKTIDVPVVYGGQYGPDIEAVAKHAQCSVEEVIKLHSQASYQVYALGFAPGFSYLGALPDALRIPRLSTPRDEVPAGSVAIAEQQTAVYPQASPGGWHIIGYSPMQWFNPDKEIMTPLEVGDQVRFVVMQENELETWRASQDD